MVLLIQVATIVLILLAIILVFKIAKGVVAFLFGFLVTRKAIKDLERNGWKTKESY